MGQSSSMNAHQNISVSNDLHLFPVEPEILLLLSILFLKIFRAPSELAVTYLRSFLEKKIYAPLTIIFKPKMVKCLVHLIMHVMNF